MVVANQLVPTVYVTRHMHKAAGDDPMLSDEGMAEAQRLAAALRNKGVAVIFVTATRRSRQSGEPLAAVTGAPIEVYDPKNTAALVTRIAAIPGSVLVVGHSNTVPELVVAFGGPAIGPMAETDYGRLFAIRRVDGATVESRP
ncbi:MAG: histidine phosphatase family protein [Sphingomicrobium sp.]